MLLKYSVFWFKCALGNFSSLKIKKYIVILRKKKSLKSLTWDKDPSHVSSLLKPNLFYTKISWPNKYFSVYFGNQPIIIMLTE